MDRPKTVWLLLALITVASAGDLSSQERSEERGARGEERRARSLSTARGWLGISYAPLESGRGVVIEQVRPGSPAAQAELVPGDTIVRWNGRRDVEAAAVQTRLQPGDTVRLRIRRSGEEREVSVVADRADVEGVTVVRDERGRDVIVIDPNALRNLFRVHVDSLEVHADSLQRRIRVLLRDSLGPKLRELEDVELPRIRIETGRERGDTVQGIEIGRRSVAGAELAPLNPELSSYFGADRGLLVTRVEPGSPAARAGLESGDVVVAADRRPVEEMRDLRAAVRRARDRGVGLEVVRKGERRELRLAWN